MDGLAWILGLFMGAAIGTGLAFLICALILNKSNNKGDSRMKPEDYSSEIMSFSDQDNMRVNRQQFAYLVDTNIEAMCRSNEYAFRNSKALPFGSKEPVTRYIPDSSENEAAVEAANAQREPVIFTSDSHSANAFRKGLMVGFSTSITTNKFGFYRTLSGQDATALAYNSTTGATLASNPAANATVTSHAPTGAPAPMTGTTAAVGGIPMAVLTTGMMADSSWAAARRQSMGADASNSPWGRDESWGLKEVKIDPTASAGKPGRQMTQEEIDAFWSGGSAKKTETAAAAPASAPAAAPAPVAPVAPVTPAPAPVAPVQTPSAAPMSQDPFFPDPTMGAQPSAPAQPGPIYEAPTATRPLWENSNSNDDFSDFSDLM